ncbi:MAG: lipase family protein [Bacteroidetes bacterium]|nr:lipase family protein [Bacteroidota bacterium]
MRKIVLLLLLPLLLISAAAKARHLQPGFDAMEFRKMFSISGYQLDTAKWKNTWMPYPTGYDLAYRSPVSGLDNRWDLWRAKDSVDVISVRGTTAEFDSWLENFYAGMIPAQGKLTLENGKTFDYKLAEDSNAYVHIGWTIGMAELAPDIVEKINSEYKNGVKDFVIVGHSQGGVISFLLTSYLYYEKGKSIPADITFKTYGSAAPKPGNQFYAYDFDFITKGAWAFRVVNSADWVPECPFTIQTLQDLSKGSAFENVDLLLGNAPWPSKPVARRLVHKMNHAAKRARKKFIKYLGKRSGFVVRKKMSAFPKYNYVTSFAYATCGVPIILRPDAHYHELYPDDGKSIFRHHGYGPYLYLLNLDYPVK